MFFGQSTEVAMVARTERTSPLKEERMMFEALCYDDTKCQEWRGPPRETQELAEIDFANAPTEGWQGGRIDRVVPAGTGGFSNRFRTRG